MIDKLFLCPGFPSNHSLHEEYDEVVRQYASQVKFGKLFTEYNDPLLQKLQIKRFPAVRFWSYVLSYVILNVSFS
jgi:hypothetical protein